MLCCHSLAPSVSIAGGLTYGIYSLFSSSFSLVDFFLEHREGDAPYLAFLLGAATTVVSVGVYKVGRRAFVLKPARMYKEAMRMVLSSEAVKERLGDDVRAVTLQRMARSASTKKSSAPFSSSSSSSSSTPPMMNFRTVSFLPASLRYRPTKDSWARYWQPRRLQVSVWIQGSKGGGLVQAEVEQALRAEWDEVNVCTVELLEQGEQIIVKPHYDTRKAKSGEISSLREEKLGFSEERDLLSQEVRKR